MYDVIVIGSGPAGYTAGIYCIRAGLATLIIEGSNYGGQLMNTVDIENYPGFPNGVNGFDLMTSMRKQCQNLGCELTNDNVISVKFGVFNPINHEVITNTKSYNAKTVIIATGATAKIPSIPGGDIYWNHGISACAVCDGALPMFRKKPLIVIGGGDTACEEALFLSRFGSIVYMLVRSDKMRASHRMKHKVETNEKIKILYNTEVVNVTGVNEKTIYLTEVTLKNSKRNTSYDIKVSGLFYAIGHVPNTDFLKGTLETDEFGYIITNNTKTKIPGVFACGDVQDKIYRQAITAAGSGCMAALEVEKYLTE